jgi:hypothetical protein
MARRLPLNILFLALLADAFTHSTLADVCSVPTFEPPRAFTTGTNSVFVASGDFNGDGKPDLAVAYQGSYDSTGKICCTDGGISVLLSNGDGTFQTGVNYAAGTSPVFVAVGDFNGDGKPDLAVANSGYYSTGIAPIDAS